MTVLSIDRAMLPAVAGAVLSVAGFSAAFTVTGVANEIVLVESYREAVQGRPDRLSRQTNCMTYRYDS